MRNTFILLLTLSSLWVNAQERKLCISIDDLPVVPYGIDNEKEITEGILSALKKHSVPAIGYVNARKLFSDGKLDSARLSYLESWLRAGVELGNHTYSHKNYHQVPFEEFAQDILDGEKIVKELVENSGNEYRFFRHPYLRSGLDSISTKRLKDFLIQNGYEEAFVTVDDDDYLFALAYARAYKKNDEILMERIGESYLKYMIEKLVYFEKASIELFDRNINHTLLIHANFLNAKYLDRLLTSYENLGYSFISQEEAISDPAYKTPVTRFGDWGISWIHKWGLSAGVKKDFFKGDPETPDFIYELTN